VEGLLSPPRDAGDTPRFERAVRATRQAGAQTARIVVMPGRRYEEFRSLHAFREAERQARAMLERAEPVAARNRLHLAVENHKDQRIEERLALFQHLDSEWIGACVDTGNNLALGEDPLEAVRALAPWAFTVHLKDQAVEPCEDGFLLADIALGQGLLNLPAMVRALRKARPGVGFNLELITRDPLRVPIRSEAFWTTMPEARTEGERRTLERVRAGAAPQPLPRPSIRPEPEQLDMERDMVLHSLRYAAAELGFHAAPLIQGKTRE